MAHNMRSVFPLFGLRWSVLVATVALLATALWIWSPSLELRWLRDVAPVIADGTWSRLIAIYLGTVLLSHLVIQPATVLMRRIDGIESTEAHGQATGRDYVVPALAGVAESTLYLTSWLIGRPEFMAFWITMKVAGGWAVWNKPETGRPRFQVFLVGNALQILFATVGYAVSLVTVLTT